MKPTSNILGQFPQSPEKIVPAIVSEYTALQLARKSGDLSNFGKYLEELEREGESAVSRIAMNLRSQSKDNYQLSAF